MPRIVGQRDALPDWCELKRFEIVPLDQSGARLEPRGPKDRLVSCDGPVNVRFDGRSQVVGNGQFLDFGPEDGPATVVPVYGSGRVVWLSGDWSDELGGCGLFTVSEPDDRTDRGDPVSYPKTTGLDSHYHDCDEYWILLDGKATVVVGGEAGDFTPGDCLCIGMGYHHDMPHAPEPVKAVYFETGLERQKRVGHLWEHTHGPASPAEGRT